MKKIVLMLTMMVAFLNAQGDIKIMPALKLNVGHSYAEGVKRATQENKPMLFISSRHTCKYCVILERTALSDPQIIKDLNKNFVTVIVYSDDGHVLPKELWRPGTPAIWFLDASGEPMYQPIMGSIPVKQFKGAMHIVKKEFAQRQKASFKKR